MAIAIDRILIRLHYLQVSLIRSAVTLFPRSNFCAKAFDCASVDKADRRLVLAFFVRRARGAASVMQTC